METVIGKCEFFDVKPFIQAADILVAADEPLRALKLLENLPGYHRDHPPEEATRTYREIHRLLATPAFYMGNPGDHYVNPETAIHALDNLLRGILIREDVKRYNEKGLTPHLIDLGPGEYWLPIALSQKGFHFTYHDIGLSEIARERAKPHLAGHMSPKKLKGDSPTIFVACEIIEHLHNEKDILVEYMRSGGEADLIHVSTPLYSFDTRTEKLNWREAGDLGHLRTYTPKEFQEIVCSMFPSYNWGYCSDQIMHMRGEKKV